VRSDERHSVQSPLGLRRERNVAVCRQSFVQRRRRRRQRGSVDAVSHHAVLGAAVADAVQTGPYCGDTNRRSDPGKMPLVARRRPTGAVGARPRRRRRRRRLLLGSVFDGGRHLSGGSGGCLVPDRVLLLSPALVVARPLHENDARKVVEEEHADPAGHAVRARRTEKPVDDDDREYDDDHVVDEREQQVVGDQRNCVRRRRKNLRHQKQKHDQRQQNRYAHGHFLA